MRELLVDTKTQTGADGTEYSFDYFVLVDEMRVGAFDCESYGVKVAQRGGTSVARIDELLERLTRNFVTPSTLRDVVEDWL